MKSLPGYQPLCEHGQQLTGPGSHQILSKHNIFVPFPQMISNRAQNVKTRLLITEVGT